MIIKTDFCLFCFSIVDIIKTGVHPHSDRINFTGGGGAWQIHCRPLSVKLLLWAAFLHLGYFKMWSVIDIDIPQGKAKGESQKPHQVSMGELEEWKGGTDMRRRYFMRWFWWLYSSEWWVSQILKQRYFHRSCDLHFLRTSFSWDVHHAQIYWEIRYESKQVTVVYTSMGIQELLIANLAYC